MNYFAFRGKEAGEVERILREKMGQRAVTGGSVGPVQAAVERAVRAESEAACREAAELIEGAKERGHAK